MNQCKHASVPWKLSLLVVSALAACGGSGGGGPSADVTITDANANQVVASAFAAGTGTVFDSASVGGGVVFARLEGEDPAPLGFNLRRFAERRILGIVGRHALPTIYIEAGAEGGTATVDWNDLAPLDVLSTGDTFSITFEDFQEDGVRLNGSITVFNVVVVGDPEFDPTWRFGCTIDFGNVTITKLGVTASIDGTIGASAEQTATQFILLVNVTGDFGEGSDVIYAGFALDYRETDATGDFTLNTSGFSKDPTLGGTGVAGVFSFQTTTPFGGNSSDEYPSSGVLLVQGAGSSVRMTVLSNVTVHLDIDTDGNGTFDFQRDVPWTTIDP